MNKNGVEIEIFDTTLRDGAQALPYANQFPDGSKADIAHNIAQLGAGVIEAGFPATLGDREEVRSVANTVGQTYYDVQVWGVQNEYSVARTPVIAGLSRTTPSDIEATWEAVSNAVRPRIHTFVSTDPEHMRAKFPGKTPEDVLQMGREAVRLARSLSQCHYGASIEFSAEAASTTEPDYLERVIKTAIEQGADVINVPDTVGQRSPFWMKDFYGRVIDWVMQENPAVTISAHNHNDLDQATANTIGLVMAAADYSASNDVRVKVQLETAIGGLGERAGNADVFPVVANLFKSMSDMSVPVRFEFNPSQAVRVARTVMDFAGLEVHRQSPIVGRDTNVHRSGIHSDGVIKGGHAIYTPHDPTFWGHESDAVHEDGKYQGKAGKRVAIS
ncbi:hypothetical protein KC867_02210 [Candidatus Saccharibacteria bacterium]|nr:hypothetical protein [Candidatus Saccharibacteria bacterium]